MTMPPRARRRRAHWFARARRTASSARERRHSRSTRCRWACPPTSRTRSRRARHWSASARRSSATRVRRLERCHSAIGRAILRDTPIECDRLDAKRTDLSRQDDRRSLPADVLLRFITSVGPSELLQPALAVRRSKSRTRSSYPRDACCRASGGLDSPTLVVLVSLEIALDLRSCCTRWRSPTLPIRVLLFYCVLRLVSLTLWFYTGRHLHLCDPELVRRSRRQSDGRRCSATMVEPLLRPARRILPPIGGFDLVALDRI